VDNKFVLVGEVVRPQGIKGKLKVRLLADIDLFSIEKGVYLEKGKGPAACYKVLSSQLHKGAVLLGLEGIDTMSMAEGLVGSRVYTEMSTLEELPEGEYYWFQIIGLDVLTEDGCLLGKVTEILPTGSNDVYVVRDGSKEYLIPAIEQVIKDIDVSLGRIVITPMKGLLGEE